MKCPKCGAAKAKVWRTIPYQGSVVRERVCLECKERYNTRELVIAAKALLAGGPPDVTATNPKDETQLLKQRVRELENECINCRNLSAYKLEIENRQLRDACTNCKLRKTAFNL